MNKNSKSDHTPLKKFLTSSQYQSFILQKKKTKMLIVYADVDDSNSNIIVLTLMTVMSPYIIYTTAKNFIDFSKIFNDCKNIKNF